MGIGLVIGQKQEPNYLVDASLSKTVHYSYSKLMN